MATHATDDQPAIRCCAVQIAGVATMCLQRLAAMLLQVCQNPTQPGFNHYLFESVAALIKFSAAADVSKVAELEQNLFPAFNIVLQQDVQVGSPDDSQTPLTPDGNALTPCHTLINHLV